MEKFIEHIKNVSLTVKFFTIQNIYQKAQRTDDTIIQLNSGEYRQILEIILIENKSHFKFSKDCNIF